MKFLFAIAILCFINLEGYSQCEKSILTDIDKFSGDTSYTTGFFTLNPGNTSGILFSLSKRKGVIEFVVSVEQETIACFKPGSQAIFLFENGSKDTLTSFYELNCKGIMEFKIFPLEEKRLNFSSTKITDIRFFSTSGYFDIELDKKDPTESSREKLPQYFTCLFAK